MTMERMTTSREQIPDLLTRPPSGSREFVNGWSHLIVDPVRQLEALADLYSSGLLSRPEFEQHKLHLREL